MKPSAILTADIHLRETSPICRTDNFLETQTRKLKWLSDLKEKYNVPILCAGDLFDHWKPSPWLLGYALRNLPNDIVAIPGQHDLPAHCLDNIDKSGIQVLADAGKIILLKGNDDFDLNGMMYEAFPWGYKLNRTDRGFGESHAIAIIHYGVYESKPHYPGAELSGGTAKSVINKLKGYDLIVSGDNHLSFSCKVGNQVLCNPGSFMRTTASQVDHQPSVYLWYAETNEVERVYIPIEKNVISREHISSVEQRDDRLESFISKLNHDMEITVNFKDNLTRYISQNNISKETENLIWSCL